MPAPTNLGETAELPGVHHTDNTRLEAFSDAIFGFAATLLVVSLDVPSSYDALVRGLYGFVSFAVSFGFLVWLWVEHRAFFRRFPLGDQTTVMLNMLLLFVILFYVYPLKFLSRLMAGMLLRGQYRGDAVAMRFDQLPGLFAIYGIGWAAVFACFGLLYLHAARQSVRAGFGLDARHVASDRFGANLLMASVGLTSAALAAGNIGVRYGVPGWAYMLLGPVMSIYWGWRNRRVRPLPVEASSL